MSFFKKGKQIIRYTNQTIYLRSIENNTIQRKIVLSGLCFYVPSIFIHRVNSTFTHWLYVHYTKGSMFIQCHSGFY